MKGCQSMLAYMRMSRRSQSPPTSEMMSRLGMGLILAAVSLDKGLSDNEAMKTVLEDKERILSKWQRGSMWAKKAPSVGPHRKAR
eukprot:2596058-Amphidinium_carterae.1